MTTPLPRIKDLPPDVSGIGFFFCSGKEVREGKGGEFVAVTLQDSTGQLLGRVFDNADELQREFDAGEFVRVQGRSQIHKGRLQLVEREVTKLVRLLALDNATRVREIDAIKPPPPAG